jgi:DHA1 family bicyclomycin/chloramphenicol resistance-like MFS transporter
MSIRSRSIGFTILLGALAALPPLSIDMGLPAFPALTRELHTTAAGAGLTLSLFMAGFAVAQLVLGPMSDRYGRRPVLLAGLSLYAAAGCLCALAPSIGVLIGLRLIEGACAASGSVMAFAIARDVFEGASARQRLSYVTIVLTVAPVVAPALGSLALHLGGWRSIYGFLGVAGVALLASVFFGLEETRQRPAVRFGIVGGFARMVGHRRAFGYALTNALGFGALFAYISGSPMVLMGSLGVSAATYAQLFAIVSSGLMMGAWVNSKAAKTGATSSLALALALAGSLVSATLLFGVLLHGGVSLSRLLPLLVLHAFCRGISSPNATHGALEPMGEIAGLASAVVGCSQMAMAALSSGLVALLFPVLGPAAMALVMTLFSAAALLAWQTARRPDWAFRQAARERYFARLEPAAIRGLPTWAASESSARQNPTAHTAGHPARVQPRPAAPEPMAPPMNIPVMNTVLIRPRASGRNA